MIVYSPQITYFVNLQVITFAILKDRVCAIANLHNFYLNACN